VNFSIFDLPDFEPSQIAFEACLVVLMALSQAPVKPAPPGVHC
jgi:hypothetical protein